MNKKWMVTLLLLLNAVGSNLYCPKNSNVDTYIEDYLNNNPITETVSTNQLDTTPITYQSTLKIMPQHIPVPAALPLINTTSLTTPAGDLQKKIKFLSCSFCSQKFTQLGHKKAHEYTHTDERPYPCSFCSQKFTQSGNKKRHERTHTSEQLHPCSFCSQKFKTSSNIKRHERTHTDETPYSCSYCPKKFKNPSNMKRHERTHNKGVQ